MFSGLFPNGTPTIYLVLKRSDFPKLALLVFVAPLVDRPESVGGMWDPAAFAQANVRSAPSPSSTTSHRHLPIPRDGSQDLMRQFQMMQHLQELVKKQDPAAIESNKASTLPSLDADLLKSLSEMLSPEQKAIFDSFKDQFGDLSQLDAQAVQRLQEGLGEPLRQPENDAMQAIMEELLRRFQQDRRVPPMQGGGISGAPQSPDGHATETSNSDVLDERAPSQTRRIDGPLAGSEDAESHRPSADNLASRIAEYFRRRGESSSGSGRQGSAAAELPAPPMLRDEGALPNAGAEGAFRAQSKQANAFGEATSGPEGTPKSESALRTPSNPFDTSVQAGSPSEAGGKPSYDPASRRKNSDLPQGTPPMLANSANINELLQRMRTSGTPAEVARALGSNSFDPTTQDATKLPSVPELLKRANEDPSSLPPFSFPENSLDMEDIKKLLAERFPKKSKDDDWFSSLKSQLPNSLKAELHKTGLKDSLTDIMEQLKNGTSQEGNAASSGSPSLDKLGAKSSGPSLGSIQDELEELSNSLAKSDEKRAESTKDAGKDSKTPSSAAKEKESKGAWASISGMYERWMKGPPDVEETGPGDPAAAARDEAPNSTSSLSIGYEGLIAIALCLAALFFGFVFVGRRQRRETKVLQARALNSLSISSRADLVKAFHLMVANTGIPVESWWTHRRAAKAVSERKPTIELSLEVLSGMYEKARYGPADEQLSEEDYEQARRALEKITAC